MPTVPATPPTESSSPTHPAGCSLRSEPLSRLRQATPWRRAPARSASSRSASTQHWARGSTTARSSSAGAGPLTPERLRDRPEVEHPVARARTEETRAPTESGPTEPTSMELVQEERVRRRPEGPLHRKRPRSPGHQEQKDPRRESSRRVRRRCARNPYEVEADPVGRLLHPFPDPRMEASRVSPKAPDGVGWHTTGETHAQHPSGVARPTAEGSRRRQRGRSGGSWRLSNSCSPSSLVRVRLEPRSSSRRRMRRIQRCTPCSSVKPMPANTC